MQVSRQCYLYNVIETTTKAVTGTLVTGTLVTGTLVTATLVTGTLVTGILVTGTLVTGILVTGTLVTGILVAGTLVTGTLRELYVTSAYRNSEMCVVVSRTGSGRDDCPPQSHRACSCELSVAWSAAGPQDQSTNTRNKTAYWFTPKIDL